MKRLLLIFLATVVVSCSFDNKTGIWKDASNTPADIQIPESFENNNSNIKEEDILTKNKTFSEEKKPLNPSLISIGPPIQIINLFERYVTSTNNISNLSFSDNKVLLTKGKKLNKMSYDKAYSNRDVVFYKNNFISYDNSGTIFIYSSKLKKKIFEYNFYKKKYKKFNKKIYLIVNKNTLYAADNLGYLYALNLDNNSILWAKNYGIPFRSNLKFAESQIFLANQDNVIYSINPNNGDKNWQFPTSITFLKSDFENNFALDIVNNQLFFLNTSGELYSINYLSQNIKWVLNFKKTALAEDTELFLGQPIIFKNNNLIISTEKRILSYKAETGIKNWDLYAEPVVKPIATLDYTYIVLKNNLLLCVENFTGNVIWSKNIFRNIEKNKIKERFDMIIDFKIVNSMINIYFKNGYLLSFNPSNGISNFPYRISKNGINSKIFYLDNNMFFLDGKSRLLQYN